MKYMLYEFMNYDRVGGNFHESFSKVEGISLVFRKFANKEIYLTKRDAA